MLQQEEEHLALASQLSNCIHDKRTPNLVRHGLTVILVTRIFQICLGYEDVDDCDRIRRDPMMNWPSTLAPWTRNSAFRPRCAVSRTWSPTRTISACRRCSSRCSYCIRREGSRPRHPRQRQHGRGHLRVSVAEPFLRLP